MRSWMEAEEGLCDGMTQNGDAAQMGRYADANTGLRFGRKLLLKIPENACPLSKSGCQWGGSPSHGRPAVRLLTYASVARLVFPAG
jgi:hypothetical protein